jgi:hypothetical protein
LVEAVLDTTESKAVSASRRFVLDLRAEPATPEYLKRLQKLWRPPKFASGKKPPSKVARTRTVAEHTILWVVPLSYTTYDPQDEKAKERSHSKAKERIASSRLFFIDDFKLSGKQTAPIKRNDLVVEVIDEGNKLHMVRGVERILDIEPYRKKRRHYTMVSVECARKLRRKNLATVLKALPPSGRILKQASTPRRIGDPLLAHALMGLWSKAQKA